MKKYGKLTYKTFQIRLTEAENNELVKFIEMFGKTRREFILAVQKTLKDKKIIRDEMFWGSQQEYSYAVSSKIYRKEFPHPV